jgi:protein phosphatase
MTDLFSVFDYGIDEFVETISKTTKIHETQKTSGGISKIGTIHGHYASFQIPRNLVVVGDIHGDFITLQKIMERIDFINFLKNESNLLIFLGDYIDRGDYSIEVLLFLCKLKSFYPKNVLLLRGNHETYDRYPFSSYDFYATLANRFGKQVDMLYNSTVLPFFESLFLFSEIKEFSLLTHGGLPVIGNSQFFKNYKFHLSVLLENKTLLEEVLWNDPRDLPQNKSWNYSNRGLGKYFGIDITNLWLSNTGCKFLIRGHEPCSGYKLTHENKSITIFSSKIPYPKFDSSFLKISDKEIDSIGDRRLLISQYIHLV